jgi:hypothetical protein
LPATKAQQFLRIDADGARCLILQAVNGRVQGAKYVICVLTTVSATSDIVGLSAERVGGDRKRTPPFPQLVVHEAALELLR